MTKTTYSEPRNVSLYPDDWQQVATVADRSGVKTLSAALRLIIRQWTAQQQEAAHVICEQTPQQDAASAM